MNESKHIYPQICQHVTVDCDSSMLSMENITWGWRGVQQRMAQGEGGSGGQWLVDLVGQVTEGVMDSRVESDHMMRVCSYNVRRFHQEVWKPDKF